MKSLNPLFFALMLGAFSTTAFANRYDNNGVPADLYSELQTIKEQLVSLQQTVGALTDYLENGVADVGDVSSKICFEARLGLEANGTIGVKGVNHAGIGTGVDLYGLLDIDAGLLGKGRAELMSMLASGVDLTTEICVNAGVIKVDGIPQNNERLQASPGLLTVLESARDTMAAVYVEMPDLVTTLDVGPQSIDDGIYALTNATSGAVAFSPSTLLNPIGWEESITGLPGATILSARYAAISNTFASMTSGDPCTYYEGIGPTIDLSLGSFINDACNAIPASLSLSPILATDLVYNGILVNLNSINNVTTETNFYLTSTVAPTLSSINSNVGGIRGTVNGIDDVVDDICSFLGC